FNVAGAGGDGNMVTAVHTRKIINPDWGSKITGTSGKFTFGALNASDASPQDIGNRGESVLGENKLFNIGRVTYGLGESNYVGALFADTEHAGRHNRVAGSDLSMRFKKRQQFSATFLESQTGLSSAPEARGTAEQVTYFLNDRKYSAGAQVEHYGK